MRRRDFLASGLALPLATLSGCKMSLEQGLYNECRTAASPAVLRSALVAQAWEGLHPDRVWDSHTHLFGNGRSGSGIWENPQPTLGTRARRGMFVNAACAGSDEETLDQGMVKRVTQLIDQYPPGAKAMLLAFEFTYDEQGKRRDDQTVFSVSNAYAERVARSRPDRFEWVASIHPYRADAITALESAKAGGARAVKWLPPTMGIDLAHPKSLAFFDAMKRLDIPLLSHVGEEKAVGGAERHEFANPLHLRHPLDRGVRVIAAHCASMGTSPDLDANPNPDKAPEARNLDLFARLMAQPAYEKLLFGDLSATTQANRADSLPFIIAQRSWHVRLLNGSDYPLPGVMPLFSLDAMVKLGLLDASAIPTLRELRQANSLLFDFVLKRCLRYQGAKFPDAVFETRPFFERA